MPGTLLHTELERLLELFDKVKSAVEADPSAVDPSEASHDLESLAALWSKVAENAEVVSHFSFAKYHGISYKLEIQKASTSSSALSAQGLLRERDTLLEVLIL